MKRMYCDRGTFHWIASAPCIFYLPLLFFVMVCVRCAVEPPGERFALCFESILADDLAAAHGYFVFIDRATITVDNFESTYSLRPDERRWISEHKSRIVFTTDSMQYHGDTMTARLIVEAPVFIERRLDLVFFSIDSIIAAGMSADSDSTAVRMRSYYGMLTMVREDGSWFIHGNWEEQRRIETDKAQERLDYITSCIGISGIKIYYVKLERPRLSALLRNQGDRTLADVEVYIIGYTTAREPCFTATVHPLGDEPLGPRSARRFSIDISQAPANWAGKIEARVLNCAFGKER